MPEIKTRDVVKGTVKTLDRAAVAGERMKDAYIRTKDKAEQSVSSGESSPAEYAADRVTGSFEVSGYEAAHQLDKQGRKAVADTKENIQKGKKYLERHKAEKAKAQTSRETAQPSKPTPQQQAKRYAQKRTEKSIQIKTRQRHGEAISHAADSSVKIVERGTKTVKQSAGSTGKATVKTAKGTVKTAQKTVKTARQTARTTVKTAEATAKAAQKSAQATVKASRAEAQTAKAAAKTTVTAVKAAAKATAAAIKAIIAGTKALISAMIAGGWVAVMVIVVICLVGLIVGSCFGIFFSGEDTGTGQTMQTVVREINEDYENELETIKSNISYDVLEMSGSRAVWPEVLSVYLGTVHTKLYAFSFC